MPLRRIAFLFAATLAVSMAQAPPREKRVTRVDNGQRIGFETRRRTGVAILVGIGRYPRYSQLDELHYPQQDVDLVEKALEAQRYDVVVLKDSEATRGAVLSAIQQAGEVIDQATGGMVFFFSGHGFALGGTNYLATFDASRNALAQSGLSIAEVERAMTRTGATRRMLWIDACRDEPGKGVSDARTFTRFAGATGTRILYSTGAGRVSYEDDQLKQGLFSYYLVRGLNGDAAKSDGLITFGDLAEFVTESVRSRSLRQGHVQVPYQLGEFTDDFLVARAAENDPPPPPRRPDPTGGTTPAPQPASANLDGRWYFIGKTDDGITAIADGFGELEFQGSTVICFDRNARVPGKWRLENNVLRMEFDLPGMEYIYDPLHLKKQADGSFLSDPQEGDRGTYTLRMVKMNAR